MYYRRRRKIDPIPFASKTHGFIIAGNMLAAGIFFLIFGVFTTVNFLVLSNAHTYISIEPRGDTFSLEHDFIIDIYVTSSIPFNAVDAEIRFPIDTLDVVGVNQDNSVIDLWVKEPTYSNENGTITFVGGTPRDGGLSGKNLILSILFHPKATGTASIDVFHSVILASNGTGTDLNGSTTPADLIINELGDTANNNVITDETIRTYTINEKDLPSPDLNHDGAYTIKDLSLFLPALKGAYDATRDFNGDGSVNLKDASILLSRIFSV